jgi:hypothetical protein
LHITLIQAGTVVGKQLSEQEIFLGKNDRMLQIPSNLSSKAKEYTRNVDEL